MDVLGHFLPYNTVCNVKTQTPTLKDEIKFEIAFSKVFKFFVYCYVIRRRFTPKSKIPALVDRNYLSLCNEDFKCVKNKTTPASKVEEIYCSHTRIELYMNADR